MITVINIFDMLYIVLGKIPQNFPFYNCFDIAIIREIEHSQV